jgi:hypothetical protein
MAAVPKITDRDGFLDEFLRRYFERGLGSLSKRDTDLLMMHLIDKYSNLADQSNALTSFELQIPESRVRSLRYESKLKHPPEEKAYIERRLLWCLAKAQWEAEKDRVIFAVEDSYIRFYLQGKLKEKGAFADNSFNTEIVKIKPDQLAALIEDIYGSDMAKAYRTNFRKLTPKEKGDPSMFREIMKALVVDGAKKLAEAIPPAVMIYWKLHGL